MKRGLFLAPFDELVDPRLLADLGARAEAAGWDGVFVWDHVAYRSPVRAISDPWVVLSAIACATTELRLGTMVTPLSRRRVQKLARETVTLDRLSDGRLTLGVGLGSDTTGELGPFGEVAEPRERARLLDDGLTRLEQLWSGEFEPVPVQRPRIPIWVASRWPSSAAPAEGRPLGRLVPDRAARARRAGGARTGGTGTAGGSRRAHKRRGVRPGRGDLRRGGSAAVGAGRRDLGPDRLREPASAR